MAHTAQMTHTTQTKQEVDRFGNLFYTLTEEPTLEFLESLKHDKGKGILLKTTNSLNLDDIVGEYNKLHLDDSQKKIKHLRDGVYLMRNGSNCPDMFDGKIYAGGASIVVKYNGQNYCILVKDKTKRVVTNLGGIVDEKEYNAFCQDVHMLCKVAGIREVKEETEGTIMYKEQQIQVKGLYVPPVTSEVVVNKFNSCYFGIQDIDDTYIAHQYYYDIDAYPELIDIPFFGYLFDISSSDQYGNYTLEYVNHDETEYVHAVLVAMKDVDVSGVHYNLPNVITTIKQLAPKIGVYAVNSHPRVSSLSMLANYINVATEGKHKDDMKVVSFSDQDMLKSIVPNLTGLLVMM